MQYCLPAVGLALLSVWARRIRLLYRTGFRAASRRLYFLTALCLGAVTCTAMLAQELILARCGQLSWRTGLPLHLCSCMGVLTLPMLLTGNRHLTHLSLYLGLPGAAAALLFPAVAPTPWPQLTALAFHTMHTGVLLAPLLPLLTGWRPAPEGVWEAGGFLVLLALVALGVNALTGGNYLFLQSPASSGPLGLLAGHGVTAYRLLLTLLAAAVLALEQALVRLLLRRADPLPAPGLAPWRL